MLHDYDEYFKVKEAAPDYKRMYTIDEFIELDDDIRAELYEGALVLMSPPIIMHQYIQSEIFGRLWNHLRDKPCKVFTSEFGVQPNENEQSFFLPDVVVVCDKLNPKDRVYTGAPSLIVEILSPSTARMDKKLKFEKYEKAGVKEYWIVDPEFKMLQANIYTDGKYATTIYNENDIVPVSELKGFEINLAEIFTDDL